MQGGRIESRMGRQQLGTAQRMTTGQQRMGTGFKGGEFQFNMPNMNFVNRPVTQHGIGGIKSGKQGPDRQIIDKSYIMTQLRNKISAIYQEINKFKKNIEDIQKDNTTFFSLEKRYEELSKEVRNLEGTLADYNLAFDKQRTNTRPEDIRNMYEYIKMQNDRLRSSLDEIFIERKSQEDQIMHIEQSLNEINQQMSMKLNELDPDQKNDYENLINENRMLIQDINNQRLILDDITNKLLAAESKLRMDTNKVRAQQFNEQQQILSRKREDLEIQLNEANLSFPEARDRLLAKIKEDNQFILNTDKQIKEIQKHSETYEKRLRDMQNEIDEEKKGEDKHKYEILYQKDKEMTDFIENFESTRKQEIDIISQTEQNIVELLEQSSKILALSGSLPTKEQFIDLNKEFEFKKVQTENAENTLQMLQVEFEKRNSELKKLDQAGERVVSEINNLKEKIQMMKQEINGKFDNLDNVKQDFMKKKQQLIKDKQELQSSQQQINDELKTVTYEHSIKENKLNLHEHFRIQSDFEKRISQNEQQCYQLRSYIATKTKDMNYQSLQSQSLQLMDDLNLLLLKNLGFN